MSFKRFSAEETKILTEMYNDLRPVGAIAQRLKRTKGSIIQKARTLGLRRDYRVIVTLMTPENRKLLNDQNRNNPLQLRLDIAKSKERARAQKLVLFLHKERTALEVLRYDLKIMDRNKAITKAYEGGARLTRIGKEVKMTKQAISLIVRKTSSSTRPYAGCR